jgi:hypothetical protein
MTELTSAADNPAGRLYALLLKFSQGDLNGQVFDVACTALSVEPRDWVNLYKVWAKFLVLIDETELAVQILHPRKQKIYSDFLAEVRQYLSIQQWSVAWSSVCGPLSNPESSLLKTIELCSFDLAGHESVISAQQLSELRKSVSELLEEILSAQISPELRMFLIEKLREIQRAIDDYAFYGSAGLRKALESILGATYFQDEAVKEDTKTNPYAAKFWEIVKNAGVLLSLASNLEKLAPYAQHLLDAVKH